MHTLFFLSSSEKPRGLRKNSEWGEEKKILVINAPVFVGDLSDFSLFNTKVVLFVETVFNALENL